MDVQTYIDNLMKNERIKRSQTQMTIKSLVDKLKTYKDDQLIQRIDDPHSYRGYYSDLSLEDKGGTMQVHELIRCLVLCLNETFEGYKGGDFIMGEDTPLWIADYSTTGVKIVGIKEGEVLTFVTETDD